MFLIISFCCCRIHRAGLYLNGDGVVVSKATPKGGLTTVELERLVKVAPPTTEEKESEEEKKEEKEGEEEKKEEAGEESTATEEAVEPVKFASEMVTSSSRSLRSRVWNIISVSVKPSAGKYIHAC